MCLCENNFLVFSDFHTTYNVTDERKSAIAFRITIFGQIHAAGSSIQNNSNWSEPIRKKVRKNICKLFLI